MERAELILAILAAPDDDSPRLVYADWLHQRGDPRGELITLQCRSRSDDAAAARELELLDAHRDEWAAELGLSGKQVQFCRGFIEWVHLHPHQLEDLAKRPRAAPIRTVRLSPHHGKVWAKSLDACATLGAERLDLSGNRLADPPYVAFGILGDDKAPAGGEISALSLSGCNLGAAGVKAVVTHKRLRSLTELVVRRNGRKGIGEALASSQLPRLRVVDASVNNLRDEGAAALAASPLRPAKLRLRRNHIGKAGLAAIVSSRLVSRVCHLDIGDNPIGAIAEPVIASPFASDIEELDIAGCNVPVADVRRLLEAMPQLTVLASAETCAALPEHAARLRLGGGLWGSW